MEGNSRKGNDSHITIEIPDVAPWIYRVTGIEHYYGDYVRELLIIAAICMMIFAPFYADDLSQDIPFIVLSSVVVIVVAALTNPLKRSIMSADTIVSAIGLIVFESWALINFQTQSPILFVLRELLALLYMAALYFSLKTLRSMVQGNIGQRVNPENIDVDSADFQDRAREVLEEINEEEKTNFTD